MTILHVGEQRHNQISLVYDRVQVLIEGVGQFTALAKLDDKLLKEPRDVAFEQIHLMIAAIPVPKHDVRVGAPINSATTRGYDISAYYYGP